MSKCPSDADLAAFLDESFPKERIVRLCVHVDRCTQCQSRLDKLTEATQGAVGKYKAYIPNEVTEKGEFASASPDAGTHIMGALPSHSLLTSLPSIPGFDVLEEIGRGGLGVVYKARHHRMNRLVALKMILAGVTADGRVVQRFLFEAEILARIQHPQVVQVFEVDTYKGLSGIPVPYLATELLEGGSLADRLRELKKDEGREKELDAQSALMKPRIAAELMEGIARALHSAHLQGVIHRDLKPTNVLFSTDFATAQGLNSQSGSTNSERYRKRDPLLTFLPKVTDFGLTKLTQEAWAELPDPGLIIGTPNYQAPEQLLPGTSQIGPETDIYAVGAILYECLSGRQPFEGSEPKEVMQKVINEEPPEISSRCRGIDRDIAAIVMRCLMKDPKQRYPSAADLADDLRSYLEMKPTTARHLHVWEHFGLWARRNGLWPG